MIKVDWNPASKQLRVFAIACAVFGGLLGVWLQWRHGASLATAGIAWTIGGAACLLGLSYPPAIRPLYVVLSAIALPIGLVLSTIILFVLYYFILTPIGLVMRLAGRDPMKRKFDPAAKSYWIPREPVNDVRRYFRQY
ncbi:MAG: SxtJ family membrane protein [Planctomycetes bacterium]|jgi:hypothetical protein|nr:SxtJ family membrane protein [Planctomycetota bacterium]